MKGKRIKFEKIQNVLRRNKNIYNFKTYIYFGEYNLSKNYNTFGNVLTLKHNFEEYYNFKT